MWALLRLNPSPGSKGSSPGRPPGLLSYLRGLWTSWDLQPRPWATSLNIMVRMFTNMTLLMSSPYFDTPFWQIWAYLPFEQSYFTKNVLIFSNTSYFSKAYLAYFKAVVLRREYDKIWLKVVVLIFYKIRLIVICHTLKNFNIRRCIRTNKFA